VTRPSPGAAPAVSIVIVSWNTSRLLESCLESIRRSAPAGQTEVIVVDNGSSDGSAALVRRRFPEVRLIENAENPGYARANNQGIRAGRAEFVLMLNADTRLHPGLIEGLAGFLRAHPAAGAAGPRIVNPDGSLQVSCYPTPTLLREAWRLFHLDNLLPFGTYAMHRWDPAAREVDVLLGACLLLRREALDRIGPLNETYFMYSEDLDLCYRLKQDGWEVWWVPDAEITHYGGRSTNQVSRQMFLRLYDSKIKFFRIYYGRFNAAVYKLILLLASVFRLALGSLAGLSRSRDRGRDRELAHNYRQLIRAILTG